MQRNFDRVGALMVKIKLKLTDFDAYRPSYSEGWYVAFSIGKCDRCGAEIESSSVTLEVEEQVLIKANLKKYDYALPETWTRNHEFLCSPNCSPPVLAPEEAQAGFERGGSMYDLPEAQPSWNGGH